MKCPHTETCVYKCARVCRGSWSSSSRITSDVKFWAVPESLALTAVLVARHLDPFQDSAAGNERAACPAAFTTVSIGESSYLLLSKAVEEKHVQRPWKEHCLHLPRAQLLEQREALGAPLALLTTLKKLWGVVGWCAFKDTQGQFVGQTKLGFFSVRY